MYEFATLRAIGTERVAAPGKTGGAVGEQRDLYLILTGRVEVQADLYESAKAS